MILNLLFGVIFSVLELFMPLLPDITWTVDSSVFEIFLGILEMVFYLFPMGTVATIMSVILSLMTFRIFVSLLKTLWDVLPVL